MTVVANKTTDSRRDSAKESDEEVFARSVELPSGVEKRGDRR